MKLRLIKDNTGEYNLRLLFLQLSGPQSETLEEGYVRNSKSCIFLYEIKWSITL